MSTQAEKTRKALMKAGERIKEIEPLNTEEAQKIVEAEVLISKALESLEGVKGRPIRPH